MNSESSVIELQGVVKCYGDNTVVDNVDLNVSAGECLLLVGHNGAGKTTLMKLMLGLTRASQGRSVCLAIIHLKIHLWRAAGDLVFYPRVLPFNRR